MTFVYLKTKLLIIMMREIIDLNIDERSISRI